MKIHAIQTGKVRIKKNQLKMAGGLMPKLMKIFLDKEWGAWLPIYAWVIEHGKGVMVVDTGDTWKTTEPGYLPRWHPYYALAVQFDIEPHQEIGPQLLNIGIDPVKDVDKVVLTHLHTDHAGGLHHFPNSEIVIQRREYRAACGVAGMLAGYLPHRWPKALRPTLMDLPDRAYGPFRRSLPLTSDGSVTLIHTPGHVQHHVSVVAKHDGIHYFLAGDTSYTEENMLHAIPDGVGTKETASTLVNIREFTRLHPTVYLPSHDPDAARRLQEKCIVPNFRELMPAGV